MFVHNEYTLKIFEEFSTGTGNVFIQARAGTGKTTSLIEMLNHFYTNIHLYPAEMQNARVCFVAFSNEVKKDLDKRVPPGERVPYEKEVHSVLLKLQKSQYLDKVKDSDYTRAIEVLTEYRDANNKRKGEVVELLDEVVKALNIKDIDEAILCSELAMEDMSDIHVKTFHGLGYGILRSVFEKAGNKIVLDEDKYHKIVKDFIKPKVSSMNYIEVLAAMKNLVNYTRLSFVDPKDDHTVRMLAVQYDIDLDKKRPDLMQSVIRWLPEVMEIGEDDARNKGIIDYTDMVYLPVKWELKSANPYKLMFVDEAQDLSKITRKLVYEQAMDPAGRAFFIGDSAQSIFGFAGSDINSVRETISMAKAKELPLDICYRCPTSHIRLAQKVVPQIKAHPEAKPGVIVCADEDILTNILEVGDMVLCRVTAPLFQKAIECLKAKIPARIRGRDLCENLITVLHKIEKAADSTGRFRYEDLSTLIDDWAVEEIKYLMKREASDTAIQLIQDKRETLHICHKDIDAKDMEGLIAGIRSLIPSSKGDGRSVSAVEFSTIHRAKGLEANRIFILEPTKLPLVWDKQLDWQYQQEMNLLYVAITRSKDFLCILGSPNSWSRALIDIIPSHAYSFEEGKWVLRRAGEEKKKPVPIESPKPKQALLF